MLMVESLPDGVFTFDLKGNVTSVNNVVLRYGYKKEELIGKSLLEFIPEKHWPIISEHLADLAEGKSTQGEVELTTKKGKVMAEFRSSPIKKRGKIVGFQSVVRDITQQKIMEEELRESEEKYRLIFENSPDGIITLDPMGNITSVNDVVLRYGYKRQELIGKNFLEFVTFVPEKHRPVLDKHVASVTSGKIAQGEMELNTPKGRLTMWFRASPIEKRKEIVGFQIILIDITKRKKMEEKLRLFSDAMKTSIDGVAVADLGGNITFVNRSFEEMWAYPFEEAIKMNAVDFWSEKDFDLIKKEVIPETIKGGWKGEVTGKRKDGNLFPVSISSSVVKDEKGKPTAMLAIFRDIAKRKRMSDKLRESEKRLRKLIEYAPDGIFVYDSMGNFVDGNRQAEKMTGYKKEELIGKNFLEVGLLPMRHIRKSIEVLAIGRSGQKTGPLELELIRKDGSTIPLEISTFPVEREGKIEVIGIARDITERRRARAERKKMEEELRESEERLWNLYESVPDGLAVYVGKEGQLIDYNKVFKKAFGYTDEELKDRIFLDFIHPDYHAMLIEEYRKEHPEEELPFVCELNGINKKGESIPIEISAGPYKKKGRIIGIEVIHRDITERKQMEKKLQEYAERLQDMVEERTKKLRESQERLLKAERLAAIGELATMVGHDLRNPLASIQNASYYLKMKLGASKDEKVRKMFRIIDTEVNYANNIVKDLLYFSRVKKSKLKRVDLISSIQDAIAQLKFPENVTLTTNFSEVPAIEADPDQLRRVFQNIALNGIQAMPKGGELTFSTRKNGDFVEVAFTDTGVGIPEKNMHKLFTPLFTTKSQGVGLGLAICKNLVEHHNGRIEVKSKAGEGSTFTVKLPIHQNKGGEKQT